MLNHCDTARMPDCWTINPYRGCSFGCRYCYARYTHEFLGLSDPLDFERQIFVKTGAGSVLAAEASQSKLQARPDRNRDGDRSLPACRGKVRGHSEHSRGARALPRPRDRDHHEVGAHRAGPRSARANLRALPAHNQRLADHAFPNSGPKARPRCSNSRAPPQDGSDARTGGSPGRDQRAPYSPGDQRPPPRPRALVPARSGLRRQVDLGGAALLDLRQSPSLPRLALRDDAREAAGIPASVRTRDGRRPALGGRAQATRCGAAQAHGTARSRFSRAWRAAAGAPRAGSLGRDGGSTLLA